MIQDEPTLIPLRHRRFKITYYDVFTLLHDTMDNNNNNNNTMFNLIELPLDMQQHVWEFVDDPRDLGRLHVTCKHLDKTVPHATYALVTPIMHGFAELIDNNANLQGTRAIFGINSVIREGKHPMITPINCTNDNTNNDHSIIGISMTYRFDTKELVIAVQAVQNPLAYVLPVTYMSTIKAPNVLDLLRTDKTLRFSSVPTWREPSISGRYTFTMHSFDMLKSIFTTYEPDKILRSRNNRYTMATIHIDVPDNKLDTKQMHVPESLYRAMSKLKYARKIRISNGKVDVNGLDNWRYFEETYGTTMTPTSYMRP